MNNLRHLWSDYYLQWEKAGDQKWWKDWSAEHAEWISLWAKDCARKLETRFFEVAGSDPELAKRISDALAYAPEW